jgi:hypothetical protein
VNRSWVLLSVLILLTTSGYAQVQDISSFNFLRVPGNARLAALGGVNVSLADRDLNLFFSNPTLISDSLNDLASASYQFYVGGVNQAVFSYGHKFNKVGMVGFGVQHISYGTIKSYDATGAAIGDFNSGETSLVISKSHQVGHFRFGANLNVAFSSIAGYRATAVLLDVGGLFVHPKKNLTVGLAMKNMGVILSDYTNSSNSKLPIDVQLGATFKPQHMPLRFSITGYNFVNSYNVYQNSQDTKKPGALDKVLRRFNFATEVLIHRNVNLMIGYNYRQHQELKLPNGGSGAGISLGFSAKVKAAEFVFSRSGFVAGKAGYTFTVLVNTKKIFIRR